jgi:heterodisulfide reductase subunit B
MEEQLLKLKTELKDLVDQIKKSKREDGYYSWDLYVNYRSKHIAYCLLRGTPLEKIENKLRDPNIPTHRYVREKANQIVEKVKKGEYYEQPKQDIRAGGQAPVAQPASSSVWSRVAKLLV